MTEIDGSLSLYALITPQWARTQVSRGKLLVERYQQASVYDDGFLEAERCFQNALLLYEQYPGSADWGETQYILGELRSQLYQRRNREEDFLNADQNFHNALNIYSKEESPNLWAVIQMELGQLYMRRYERNGQLEHIRRAEQYYNNVLDLAQQGIVLPRELEYAERGLGVLFSMRYLEIQDDADSNLSAQHLLNALQIMPSINIYTNFGHLFTMKYRVTGNEDDFRSARQHLQKAIISVKKEDDPEFWGELQHHLGNLYSRRYMKTYRTEDWLVSKKHYENALSVKNREIEPFNWSMTQVMLGQLQASRAVHYNQGYSEQSEKSAEEAREYFQNALQVRSRTTTPIAWATVQLDLGHLIAERYKCYGRDDDWRESCKAYSNALETFEQADASGLCAAVRHALGKLYARRYERLRQDADCQMAVEYYRSALHDREAHLDFQSIMRYGQSLAQLYVQLDRWTDAHDLYQTSLSAARNRYLAAQSADDRRQMMREQSSLYAEDALCLVHLGRLAEALARLDEGRARLVGEAVGLDEAAYCKYGEQGLEKVRSCRQALQKAEAELDVADARISKANTDTELQEYAAAFSQRRETLRHAFATLNGVIQELGLEVASLQADDFTHLAVPADMAVVALDLTDVDAYALVLHNSTISSKKLPGFTKADLYSLVFAMPRPVESWINAYNSYAEAATELRHQQAMGIEDVSIERARLDAAEQSWSTTMDAIATKGDYEAGWYYAYHLAFDLLFGEGNVEAYRAAQSSWRSAVARTTIAVQERLWVPLEDVLPANVSRILLIPAGESVLLPLHAAAPAYLSVFYAPSLGVWQQCQARAAARSVGSLFLPTPATDLYFTEVEAEWLELRFHRLGYPVTRLPHAHATANAVLKGAIGHSVVHFSGHANYQWEAPLRSALACADRPLSLATIRREMDLTSARLVTLSACETGISDVFASGEESVGLPGALLEAGVPAVVASLWPVYDVSTAFLMDRFYQLWLDPEARPTIAEALHRAAQWLRTVTKAELLERIAASDLAPGDQEVIQSLLTELTIQQPARVSSVVGLGVVEDLDSKAWDPPFAAPYYWAAFAAHGAAV